MKVEEITPLVLTYNEAANIARTMAGLAWAREIVVVDSGSTDGTLCLLEQYPAVRVVHRTFDNFASQCNFGLEQLSTPWAFSIDADYVCPPEFESELRALSADVDGYQCSFTYCVEGRPLRACLYPPRVSLFRVNGARYVTDGHAHKLRVSGRVAPIKTRILHDDRKPLARWLLSQASYADLEVDKLLSVAASELGWKDRLRKRIVWAPPLTLFYCLIGKGLILDGWPGMYYTMQRVYAELLLSVKLLDYRLGSKTATINCETESDGHPVDSTSVTK
jgi:glycosyltransferase involved in cell wall biosynthesis